MPENADVPMPAISEGQPAGVDEPSSPYLSR